MDKKRMESDSAAPGQEPDEQDFNPTVTPTTCTYDPQEAKGPIGMFHCPECGEMVLAGVPHPGTIE
jgi:hypothetical protein